MMFFLRFLGVSVQVQMWHRVLAGHGNFMYMHWKGTLRSRPVVTKVRETGILVHRCSDATDCYTWVKGEFDIVKVRWTFNLFAYMLAGSAFNQSPRNVWQSVCQTFVHGLNSKTLWSVQCALDIHPVRLPARHRCPLHHCPPGVWQRLDTSLCDHDTRIFK